MPKEQLLEKLNPVLRRLKTLDVGDPEAARRSLEDAFPPGSPPVTEIRELFRTGVEEGWLCDQGGGRARFSRLAKPEPETENFSIDAVRLAGPGVWHRHTGGEIDLCFAVEPTARFDGHPEGWVVFGPGSDHVPTVEGGTMDILYFIPGGAVEWKR